MTLLLAMSLCGCVGSPAGRADDGFLLRLGRGLVGPFSVEAGAGAGEGASRTLPLLWHSGEQRRGPVTAGLTVVPPLLSAVWVEEITAERPQSSWQADLLWPLLRLEGETAGEIDGVVLGGDRFGFELFGLFTLRSAPRGFSWHVLWPLGPGYESDREGRWIRFLGGIRVKVKGPVEEFEPPASVWAHEHRRSTRLLEAARAARRLVEVEEGPKPLGALGGR